MDIQKEREAFEKFKAKQIGIDYETLKKDLDDCEKRFPNNRYAGWNFKSDWELWQAAKAQAVPEGFVLIKDDTKTVVAIERMVEQQVEASGMDSRRLERLDGWKIIEAAVKAQEPTND